MPRSPTPSNTPSVWVDALCAWPTLTRCPTQVSGISFSDIVSDIAASLRGRQLRLQHSEAFAPQHVREMEREMKLVVVAGEDAEEPGTIESNLEWRVGESRRPSENSRLWRECCHVPPPG